MSGSTSGHTACTMVVTIEVSELDAEEEADAAGADCVGAAAVATGAPVDGAAWRACTGLGCGCPAAARDCGLVGVGAVRVRGMRRKRRRGRRGRCMLDGGLRRREELGIIRRL